MSYLFWPFVLLSIGLVNGNKVSVTIPPEYLTGLLSASMECIPKTGVEPDVLQHLLEWSFKDSDQLRKFIYCFGTTSGYADKTGHFKTDMMSKLVGNNKHKKQFEIALNECNKSVGKDKYETFYKAAVCFHDKTPIMFKV